MKRAIRTLLIAFCAWPVVAQAAPKIYLTGKLVSIKSPEVLLPLPFFSVTFPINPTYEFEIQQCEVVYVGYCQHRDYKAEWHVGDEVQFRMKKSNLYLRRPNGKEFRLEFLLEATLGPDGKPVTILSQRKR